MIEDPHGLVDGGIYRNFVTTLFYNSIVDELASTYSSESGKPIVFNLLWKERQEKSGILQKVEQYRSWVDLFIWNEIEHPLNSSGMQNTLWDIVEQVKNQKRMSTKFNPFKVADSIFFNGLNPNNKLTEDELALVQDVIDYHSKPMYDYEIQKFSSDQSTRYAYYRELEFFEYLKMVMFVMNNVNSFLVDSLSYDLSRNKFLQYAQPSSRCVTVMQMFREGDDVLEDASGKVVVNHEMVLKVAKFLCDYAFHVQSIRENVKTIAQKHAMRGTGALLAHIVNDYLIKELPVVRDMLYDGSSEDPVRFMWEVDQKFNNYGNVKILEYEDDNEYFNIDPEADVRFTERTNARYWEQLATMGDGDSIGVFTKGQMKNFYREVLGMDRLQPQKPDDYDDVCDFLVDLFKIGANPIEWNNDDREVRNPIDDIINKSEKDYGYTKQDRLEVQNNVQLRRNQESQFLEYSGDWNAASDGLYDYVNNRIFYWKNTDYSSHMLHPFMYNLKLWNRLNNIIVNGYKDYVNSDMVDYFSSKVKFDDLFGEYGESRNFWKYNVMDLTGYTTRYEAAIKDEHREDFNSTVSPLTGYDGLFYPDAAKEFLDLLAESEQTGFSLPEEFFKNPRELSTT